MGSEESRISVYSLADLKNTTDDALPNYLNSLRFKQSHHHTDVRLALGFSAVSIAAATFFLDYRFGWDKTKAGTLWAVIAYFVLNGALTLWLWLVERGCVYSGELNGTQIHTRAEKHNPTYFVSARYSKSGSRGRDKADDWHTVELQAPFATWFDGQGHFVATHFQSWLATGIPLVGGADPKKVVPQSSADEKVRKGDPGAMKAAAAAAAAAADTSSSATDAPRKRPARGKR